MEWTEIEGKVAGIALLLSLAVIFLALGVVSARGEYAGFTAGLSGYEGIGNKISGSEAILGVNPFSVVLQVLGFGILTAKLIQSGEGSLAIPAFGLVLLAVASFTIRITFEGQVTAWAARYSTAGGTVPEIYEALRGWARYAFDLFYVGYLVAGIAFGWAVLRAELLAPWVGWVSIFWGVLWLLASLVPIGIPGFVYLYPLMFGIALLIY